MKENIMTHEEAIQRGIEWRNQLESYLQRRLSKANRDRLMQDVEFLEMAIAALSREKNNGT
jgi:hypothetical protein